MDKEHFVWLCECVQMFLFKPNEDEWRTYPSVNYANIGSDNGLSPARGQTIISTNNKLLSITL